MTKTIKDIALTRNAYQKYPSYVITIPMKAVKDMGLEDEHSVRAEYDDVNKILTIKKIKEQD